MLDEYESFRRTIQSSPILRERWIQVTDKRIADAASVGVTIDREDCLRVDAIRAETISGDSEVGQAWLDQAQEVIPQFKESAERARLAEALAKKDADAMAAVAKMSPTERMKFARAIPGQPEQRPKELTSEEREAALREISTLRGSARLAAARKAGLAG